MGGTLHQSSKKDEEKGKAEMKSFEVTGLQWQFSHLPLWPGTRER